MFLFPNCHISQNSKLSSPSTQIIQKLAGYFVAFPNVLLDTIALTDPVVVYRDGVADAQAAVSLSARSVLT